MTPEHSRYLARMAAQGIPEAQAEAQHLARVAEQMRRFRAGETRGADALRRRDLSQLDRGELGICPVVVSGKGVAA